ncbi:tyrosine-type recombinase/integrase [Trinickia caryophylli]|uniref:Site-specific recombinase XerD n=1 Tax=Trinickia caryophylli TaxID=28094 RepID=A0A1X7CZY6_TRICW|nr:tyrosine-type recombinase/integrase [Trinickia caryophylli]WQE15196.1 tyrosine-type recombinase/integrase [Trinickia caryophylli]SMF05997.1 Site-specific recombinase XerD [Trinickia caryophylli]
MKAGDLENQLAQYLDRRESLRYRQTHRGALTRFVRDYVIEHPGEPVRADYALAWITRVPRAPQTQSAILGTLRGFLRFVQLTDPATAVPDNHLLRFPIRTPPFIWNAEQLRSILEAAANVRPRGGLRASAYVTVLGLPASSGLRISEALRLDVLDVHLVDAIPQLDVRETKFKKSRIVPLHPTTVNHRRQYADRRGHRCHARQSNIFFVTDRGQQLDQKYLERWFSGVTDKLGLRRPGGRRPTLHSLRHTFAVNRLTQWYNAQVPVWDLIPNLSVYLGHVSPSDSYWYISATPGLRAGASDRFAMFATSGGEE